MAFFNLFNKPTTPYKDKALNQIYELLFCDNLDLYKNQQSDQYPWNILFSANASLAELTNITTDPDTEARTKMLAYNRITASGQQAPKKELVGVIVEVGMENGLDTLAAYSDGTARYINHAEKVIIWETATTDSIQLTRNLFQESIKVVDQIGPWDKPRLPHPAQGGVRLTFLVSDGLYFGEGPLDVFFNDALAKPVLAAATGLMQYLTEQGIR